MPWRIKGVVTGRVATKRFLDVLEQHPVLRKDRGNSRQAAAARRAAREDVARTRTESLKSSFRKPGSGGCHFFSGSVSEG